MIFRSSNTYFACIVATDVLMPFVAQYYCEPETGLKFRSLIAIERYLAGLDEDAPLSTTLEEIMENKPLARAFKLENHKVSSFHCFEMMAMFSIVEQI